MSEGANVRRAAAKSLADIEKHGKYVNLEVASSLGKSSFSDADKRLYANLVYGVVERIPTLDYVISSLSSRSAEKIDTDTLTCLRLGLYQLIFTDKIPDHAAVSETVEACPRRSRGFVNAILREFIRGGKKYDLPDPDDTVKYFSVKYSCPEAMCAFLVDKLGWKTAEGLLSASVSPKRATVRVNTLVTDADTLLKEVFKDGKKSDIADDMIEVDSLSDADMTDCRWFVQDAASRIAVSVLAPKAGETVVDTCSAPGGKSFSAAIDMGNEGKIYSYDLHENKINLIKSGRDRLGIDIIEASCRDAASPDEKLVGRADRVICDAPCSGLGVMSKKPDIKYKEVREIARLPAVQLRVLLGAAEYVKRGGTLVYSTCTVNPDENEGVVREFLRRNESFSLVPFSVGDVSSDDGMMTLFPHLHGTDGFFIAKMVKKTEDGRE